jgi:hypothetical protein
MPTTPKTILNMKSGGMYGVQSKAFLRLKLPNTAFTLEIASFSAFLKHFLEWE